MYADRVGRRPLLRLAQRAVLVDVHVRVPRALLAAGHADVANVPAVAHPSGDRAGGAEVDVVRDGRRSRELVVATRAHPRSGSSVSTWLRAMTR